MEAPLDRKRLPNLLSFLRIGCSAAMLALQATSPYFFALYAFSGLTDALDGYLARRFHAESTFGARLDSAADACFFLAVLLSIPPALTLPAWTIFCAVAAALLRAASLLISLFRFGRAALLHTNLNRATGLALYLLFPALLLPGEKTLPLLTASCALALVSSCEELILMLRSEALNVDVRGMLHFDFRKRSGRALSQNWKKIKS